MFISSNPSQKFYSVRRKREKEREYNIPYTEGAHVGGMSPPAIEMLSSREGSRLNVDLSRHYLPLRPTVRGISTWLSQKNKVCEKCLPPGS